MTKQNKIIDYRTINMFGKYNVYKVIVDEDGDVIDIGDPVLSKDYRSYTELLFAGLTSSFITYINCEGQQPANLYSAFLVST